MHTAALVAKTALKAKLDTLAETQGVQTTWGFPTREPEKRWCYVGEITWASSQWVTNRSREEVFSIVVAVCIQVMGSPQEVETAAVELLGAAEAAVKEDVTLGIEDRSVVVTDFVPKRLASWPEGTDVIEAQFSAEVVFKTRL